MKKFLYILSGTALVAIGLDWFLIPAKIAAGGVSGIATIFQHILGIKASVTVLALNIPLLFLAYWFCGKKFILKTLFASVALSAFLEIFSGVSPLVEEPMLCTIAGGILSGVGMGLVFMADASTGGTDVVALLLQKIKPHIPVGTMLLVADGVVVLVSGILFKSFDVMIYACICVFITTKIIDNMVSGLDFAKQITIISKKATDISDCIINELDRGVTGIKCVGQYSKEEGMMLITIVKRNQIVKVKDAVNKYDKNAFVIVSDVHEVIGEGFKE